MSIPKWCSYVDEVSASKDREAFEKDQYIAGLVSSVDIRPKANGVGTMCKVTIEDFKGSVTFTLFDKDYEAFSGFLRVHEFLLLRVYVAPRFNKVEDKNARGGKRFEISGGFPKIRAISLLANVRESMIKEMVIDVPLEIVDGEFVKALKKAVRHNKGKSMLTLNIYDMDEKINAEFFSRKYSVTAADDFLSFLKLNGLHYRINKS